MPKINSKLVPLIMCTVALMNNLSFKTIKLVLAESTNSSGGKLANFYKALVLETPCVTVSLTCQ